MKGLRKQQDSRQNQQQFSKHSDTWSNPLSSNSNDSTKGKGQFSHHKNKFTNTMLETDFLGFISSKESGLSSTPPPRPHPTHFIESFWLFNLFYLVIT